MLHLSYHKAASRCPDAGRKERGSMTSWWCVKKARQHFVHFWILTATFLWVLQGRFSPWICRASDGWWWHDDIGGSAHGKAPNTLDTVLSALQHKAQGDASTLQFGGMMWNASIIFYPSIKLMFAFVPHNGDVHRFSVPPASMMAENSESTMSIFDPQNKDVTWSLRIQRQRRKTSCCFSSWIFPSPHCRVKLTRFSLHVAASHQHFSFAWFDSLSRSIVDSRIVFSSLQRLRATMTRLENLFKFCNAWFFKLLRYYEKWRVESLNEFNAPSCTSLNRTVWKTSSRLKPEMSNWKDLFLDSLVIFFLKFAESTQCNCVFLFATNPRIEFRRSQCQTRCQCILVRQCDANSWVLAVGRLDNLEADTFFVESSWEATEMAWMQTWICRWPSFIAVNGQSGGCQYGIAQRSGCLSITSTGETTNLSQCLGFHKSWTLQHCLICFSQNF